MPESEEMGVFDANSNNKKLGFRLFHVKQPEKARTKLYVSRETQWEHS